MSEQRTQINVRLSRDLIEQLDKKRMELQPELGKIPTRSDVMRLTGGLPDRFEKSHAEEKGVKDRSIQPARGHAHFQTRLDVGLPTNLGNELLKVIVGRIGSISAWALANKCADRL